MSSAETSRLLAHGASSAPSYYDNSDIHLPSSAISASWTGWGLSKSIVLGGLDGVMASFILVCGTAGAHVPWKVILVLGISCNAANGFSIGINEYFSSKAHRSFIQSEKRRATWQYKNFKKDEIDEMVGRLQRGGMSKMDAQTVADKVANYEDIFIKHVMIEELGFQLPDDSDATLLVDSFVMLLAYSLIGSIPFFIYAARVLVPWDDESLFWGSAGVTAVVVTVLGYIKSSFSSVFWLTSIVESLVVVAACGALAFFLGCSLQEALLEYSHAP